MVSSSAQEKKRWMKYMESVWTQRRVEIESPVYDTKTILIYANAWNYVFCLSSIFRWESGCLVTRSAHSGCHISIFIKRIWVFLVRVCQFICIIEMFSMHNNITIIITEIFNQQSHEKLVIIYTWKWIVSSLWNIIRWMICHIDKELMGWHTIEDLKENSFK